VAVIREKRSGYKREEKGYKRREAVIREQRSGYKRAEKWI